MTRWLLIPLGLAAVAGALWVLAAGRLGGDGPPLDEVGAEDRARLEALLRDADADATGWP